MKLKLIFLYLAGLLASFSLSNAQRLTVRGQVIDEIDNEALPFTQIAIYNITDSTIITGGIANESGVFEISDLNPGQFRAELSFIGYDPLIISPLVLTTGTRVYDLGVLTLRLSKNLLDEIEIVGQVPTTIRRLEKQVYNANQFQQALGGTSLDILKSIPSVNVSPDGDVTLRGTGGFMVYLNGKPAMIDPSVLLATISANSISTVEIITVPTASYNAEGKGGIININTRKSAMQGTNVSGTLMSGGTPVNKEFDPIRYGGSLGISHTKNKLTLFAGIDYSRRNVRASREGKARLLQEDDTYYWMVAEGPKPEWYINFGGRLGAEIELSEKESLSFGFYSGAKTDGRIAEYIYDNFYGDIHENRINNPRNIIILNSNNSERMGSFNSLSADYSRKFSNAAEISLSLLYEHSRLWTDLKNKDISRMEMNFGDTLLAYKQSDNNPLDGYRLSVDYTLPFKNGHELSFGYQPQFFKQYGIFDYDTLDVINNKWNPYTEFLNEVNMSRWIHGTFVNYSGFNGNLTYNLGLRMEYTNQYFRISNPDYLSIFDRETYGSYRVQKPDFFPALHLQYNVTERDKLLIAYSKRINRPPSKNMAPFLMRRHYEVFEIGDPALRPEFSNIAEISYSKGLGRSLLTLTAFYRNTDNAIFRVNTTLNPGDYPWYSGNPILLRSYTNAGDDHATGIELSGDLKFTDNLNFYIGGAVYNYRVKGDIFGFHVNRQSTNWNLNSHLNWDISKNLRFFWSHSLASATVTAQGGNDLFYLSDAVLTWIPKKASDLNLSLKMEDVFGSNNRGFYTKGQDMNGVQIFYQETMFYRYGPVFQLNLTYSLTRTAKKSKLPDSEFGKMEF